jgi:hypothetical protein
MALVWMIMKIPGHSQSLNRCWGRHLLYDNGSHARCYTDVMSVGIVVPLVGIINPRWIIGAGPMTGLVRSHHRLWHLYKMGLLMLKMPVAKSIATIVVDSKMIGVGKEMVVVGHGEYQSAWRCNSPSR